jgi:hypothetical protein
VALVEVDVDRRGSGVVCALRWVPPGSGDWRKEVWTKMFYILKNVNHFMEIKKKEVFYGWSSFPSTTKYGALLLPIIF